VADGTRSCRAVANLQLPPLHEVLSVPAPCSDNPPNDQSHLISMPSRPSSSRQLRLTALNSIYYGSYGQVATCVLTICWAEAMVAIKMPTVMITTATYFDLEYLTKAMQ
jgi:hypothetical protein